MKGLLLILALVEVRAVDYAKLLSPLFDKSDKNGDNLLTYEEFQTASANLGLDENKFDKHGKSLKTFYTSMDKNGDGLSMTELAQGAIDTPSYTPYLQGAFASGAGKVPSIQLEVPTTLAEAKAKVTLLMEVEGNSASIYPGERAAMIKYMADQCGVTITEVIMSFITKDSRRRLLVGRKLQAAQFTEIEGTAFVKDNAAADAAMAKLPKDQAAFAAVPAFSSVKITKVSVAAKKDAPIVMTTAILVGLIMLLLAIGVCAASCVFAKKNAAKEDAEGGCCTAGCCSWYAVRQWASGEVLACVVLGICMILLFGKVSGLATHLTNLIDALMALVANASALPGGVGSSLGSAVPADMVNLINTQKSQLALMPIAVIVPGLVVILLSFSASACASSKARPGTWCCTKCAVMIVNIFLLLSLILYAVLAGAAIALQQLPPALKNQIALITGMCDTIPSQIKQMVSDNMALIAQLKSLGLGAQAASFESSLTTGKLLATSAGLACDSIAGIFDSINTLFEPSAAALVAVIFMIYFNQALCCVTGCCYAKKTSDGGGKVAPEA